MTYGLQRFRVHLALIFLAMAVTCGPAFAPDNEFQLRLGQAVADTDNPAAFSFLNEINERDLRLFAPKVFNVYLNTWGQMRAMPFRESYVRYPLVLGVLGELYLNVRERKLAEANPGSEFLDTEAYDSKNIDGSRPDGLVVRRQADGVLVENIIESKMGGAPYSPAQLYGFVRVWQIVGLTMPDGKHYKPEEIRILIEGESVPLMSLPLAAAPNETLARLEKAVSLYGSEKPERPFAGKLILTPFTTSQAVKVSKRFIGYAWLGARATAEKVTETLSKQKPLPRGYYRRRKIAEPKIRTRIDRPERDLTLPEHILYPPEAHSGLSAPEKSERDPDAGGAAGQSSGAATRQSLRPKPKYDDTPGDDNSLIRYIEENLEFPTHVQRGLARHMARVGGRMTVFAEMLDEATRRKLIEKGKAPAIGPMEHWLTETNLAENEGEVRGALRAYLNLYGKKDPVPLLEKLKKRPEWNAFLEQNSVESLRETTCHENLGNLSPRDLPGSEGLGPN
jgi:hypothetical protein